MDRTVPFADVVGGHRAAFCEPSHLLRRREGRLRDPALDRRAVHFQLTQRAEFFEEIVARDHAQAPHRQHARRAHADPKRFRRLHVIVGDANLAEVATFLKLGTTSLVLAMIEDGACPSATSASPTRFGPPAGLDRRRPQPPAHPGGRLDRDGPRDPGSCSPPPGAREGARPRVLGDEAVGDLVIERWRGSSPAWRRPHVPRAPARLGGQAAPDRGLPGAPRLRVGRLALAALDLQYHDLRPERSCSPASRWSG